MTLTYLKGKDAESEEARSPPIAAAWHSTHNQFAQTQSSQREICTDSRISCFRPHTAEPLRPCGAIGDLRNAEDHTRFSGRVPNIFYR